MTPLHDPTEFNPGNPASLVPSPNSVEFSGFATPAGANGVFDMDVFSDDGGVRTWSRSDGYTLNSNLLSGGYWIVQPSDNGTIAEAFEVPFGTPPWSPLVEWETTGLSTSVSGIVATALGANPAGVGSLAGSSGYSPADPGSLLPAGGTASPGAVGPLVPTAPEPPAPSDAVRYVAQTRTTEEKAIARGNIGMTAAGSALVIAEDDAAQRDLIFRRATLDCTPENPLFEGPLQIPTDDGLKQVTHPSVIYSPTPIGGYCWWMAYTPFPDMTREDPNVCCSNDGIHWERHPEAAACAILPANWKTLAVNGLENYDWCADTHIHIPPSGQPDAGKLVIYFIALDGSAKSDCYRIVSEDGVTWGDPELVIERDVLGAKVTSPAVEFAQDGTLWMWTCGTVDGYAAADPSGIFYRTSTDGGLTWSAVQTCVHPKHCVGYPSGDLMIPWHLDVKWAAGKWHMLLDSAASSLRNIHRLFYLTSTDGITWTGDVAEPAVPLLGLDIPGFASLPTDGANAGKLVERHYRSCFLPIAGNPLAWRIWVASSTGSSTSENYEYWVLALLNNHVLDNKRRLRTLAESDFIDRHMERIVCTPTAWRMIGSASNPATITASTQSVLLVNIAANTGSSGMVLPYSNGTSTGTGFVPSYLLEGGTRDRLFWYNKYRLEATFMILSTELEAYFLLGVSCAYTNATGIVGRCFGFAIRNNQIYAVGNEDNATDQISIDHANTTLIGPAAATGAVNKISMTVTADGGADVILNGKTYRVAAGMPQAINNANFNLAHGDEYCVLPGIFVKHAPGSSGSTVRTLYVNRLQAALLNNAKQDVYDI